MDRLWGWHSEISAVGGLLLDLADSIEEGGEVTMVEVIAVAMGRLCILQRGMVVYCYPRGKGVGE
jgi:hypothetical protein